jgi:hypothetical protein
MTVPHYGKREPGALTAAAPGDTLYFNFASYNDSGDSEALTGLAVTDIEVFKNGNATTRATDSGYSLISDTGMLGDRAGLYRFSVQLFNTADDTGHYESGAWYQVAVDSVGIDGKTVRLWLGSFEIGRQRVDVRAINGDTGAAGWLSATYAGGFSDTGMQQRLDRIQSDVDTGLRTHIDDSDTGVKDAIADLDTGLRDYIDNTDTGLRARINTLAEDTGGVNINAIFGDTGAANQLRAAFANGFNDTGITNRFDRIQSEVDTGLRVHIDDSDTGLKDHINDLDTGLRALLSTTGINVKALVGDTGAANWLKTVYTSGFTDTGLYSRLDKLAEDTGGVSINALFGDTGAAERLRTAFVGGFTDTGLNERLARIQSDVDTGLRVHIDDSDTGVKDAIADLDTGLRDYIDNTDTGIRKHIDNLDTGIKQRFNALAEDTGGVSINAIFGDTGAAERLRTAFVAGFNDTGVTNRFDRLQFEVDTGIRSHIDDLDTGLRDHVDNTDTGLRKYIDNLDTGIKERFDSMAEDTGGVNINAIAGDTGAASRLQQFAGAKLSSTGMVDTGTLAGTRAGTIDANIVSVNETTVQGTGANGDEWRPS